MGTLRKHLVVTFEVKKISLFSMSGVSLHARNFLDVLMRNNWVKPVNNIKKLMNNYNEANKRNHDHGEWL